MEELINSGRGSDYDRYEALTLQKEQLEKDAEDYYFAYIREFGELTTASFELKIDCIALKKEISLYVSAKNAGRKLRAEDVAEFLKIQMSSYREELARMLKEKEIAGKSVQIGYADEFQIKSIYKRLAKLLHPDISPLTGKYPALAELFQRIVVAYRCNDLKELRKLEVLVNRELEEHGINDFSMIIPDISDRIAELLDDIEHIVSHEPYTYKKILDDPDAVEDKKRRLTEEIGEYKKYKAELEEQLRRIKELVNG